MLLKSSFVKWVSLPIFQKYISVHFLQIHKPPDSIILKCSEMSIDQTTLVIPHMTRGIPEKSNSYFYSTFISCLVVLLIMIVSTLVDEVDRVLGEGPEDLKTLMNQASIPLTMSMKPFLCISYSTLSLLHRNREEMVNHVGWFPLLLPR